MLWSDSCWLRDTSSLCKRKSDLYHKQHGSNPPMVRGSSVMSFRCFITDTCSTSVYPELTDRSFTICNTAFMYENKQDSSPQTNVNCGISSVNWSYFRVQPEEAKTTSSKQERHQNGSHILTMSRSLSTSIYNSINYYTRYWR